MSSSHHSESLSERNGLLERPSIPAPTLQLPKPVVLPNNDEMKIMSLADFTLLKVLGKGSFGKVSRRGVLQDNLGWCPILGVLQDNVMRVLQDSLKNVSYMTA